MPKLTQSKADRIRELARKGESQRALARKFGVSRSCIYAVVHNETWIAKK